MVPIRRSWHAIRYHAMICHDMEFHDLSWYVMTLHTMSWHVTRCHDMSCRVMTCHGMSCHFRICRNMSWHGITSHDMSWHVMTYHMMSWHVVACHDILQDLKKVGHVPNKCSNILTNVCAFPAQILFSLFLFGPGPSGALGLVNLDWFLRTLKTCVSKWYCLLTPVWNWRMY